MHEVYLLAGSNIQPEHYIPVALTRLREIFKVGKISPVWETPPLGSYGPNFLNLAVQVWVDEMTVERLKFSILRNIEESLGRARGSDKFAPRTIDLDILIFDGKILEPGIWRYAHIACPLSNLLPELSNPETGQSLEQAADHLKNAVQARMRTDLDYNQVQ